MKYQYNGTAERQPSQTKASEPAKSFGAGPLEVNVIFTDRQATAAALRYAQSLARDLGARIHLRGAIVVPLQLPLDNPPVSVAFTETLLRHLAGLLEEDAFEPRVGLYICRDWTKTLVQMLIPNSLIVIGGRKRWWPTAPSRMAASLRARGHRVIFVDPAGRTVGSFPGDGNLCRD